MPANRLPATRSPHRLLALAAYPLLFAAMVAVIVLYREQIWTIATRPEELRQWVSGFGAIAPLVFVAVQALQIIVFVIPGEVPQIAGGYLFGITGGLLLTVAGSALGSAVAFLASRLLGIEFLRAILRGEQLDRLQKMASSPRATITFFLFFLIPGIPKDVLCYVAGLSRMRLSMFLVIATVGRLPGVVGSVVMGDAAAEQRWLFAGIVMALALALFGAGVLFRARLLAFLERFANVPAQSAERGADVAPEAPAGGEDAGRPA